jgi:hypothetical protein
MARAPHQSARAQACKNSNPVRAGEVRNETGVGVVAGAGAPESRWRARQGTPDEWPTVTAIAAICGRTVSAESREHGRGVRRLRSR